MGISFFYPKTKQGYVLGMNGGLGNLGVSLSQLLVPICMSNGFGKPSVSSAVEGWPAHAGWFWFPICAASALGAFIWMSNMPAHGNHTTLINLFYFYWMELTAIGAALIAVIILITTKNAAIFQSSGGQIGCNFMLVAIAAIIEHFVMYFIIPAEAKKRVREQVVIFKDKHTYLMTYLHTMCFGSFIGYSGSFPKLITDIFGYINVMGCKVGEDILQTMTEAECLADGGVWGEYEITNPNAPNVFSFAWMGAGVGSLIRPVGGILADKYGGARVTMIAIIICSLVGVCQGILLVKTRDMEQPEKNFPAFLILFLILFLCTGAMSGSILRTIGVLFPPEQSGTVIGWSSAIASYSAFVIPAMFGVAIDAGRPETTFFALAGYHVSCGLVNFFFYIIPGASYTSMHYSGRL